MATLLSATDVRLEWSDINNRTAQLKTSDIRSPGIHLSSIIRYIAKSSGLLESTIQEDEEEMPLRMAVGMAWEEWAVGLYKDMVWQPGELSLDDIHGSPDGFGYEPINGTVHPCLDEFKATWKTEHQKNVLAQWLWMSQVKGYCKMYSAASGLSVRLCRLHVLWINGDYRPPQPKYYRYLIQFSDLDIESNWQLMLKSKPYVEAE